jgi:hypothetical protein
MEGVEQFLLGVLWGALLFAAAFVAVVVVGWLACGVADLLSAVRRRKTKRFQASSMVDLELARRRRKNDTIRQMHQVVRDHNQRRRF